jgi:beta-lactamase regulating signal transducer with metallopeptidase domain
MIQLLGEWALRSSILILSGALLLWALRVKDPAIRLAAWTVMLCGSLAIPVLIRALPKIPLTVMRTTTRPADSGVIVPDAAQAPVRVVSPQNAAVSKSFDWPRAAVAIYLLVAATLLLRLCAGLWMSRRLLAGSRATGLVPEVRESSRVAAPVTLGVVRSTILLPVDWREWEGNKLDAVLAHERSHIRRRDPAVQLLSAIHRALVWHSPLSWFLHRRIVRVSEEASDDAAVMATSDRASYAEILLDFMRRGTRGPNWHGVAMARYGRPDKRIHRILDETSLSRGVTRWSMAAILALVTPLACVVAAMHPQAQHSAGSPMDAGAPQTPASQATVEPAPPAKAAARRFRRYMIFSGDSMSGSWDSRDPVDEQGLKARFGRNFVWFRQGGNEYVVTDTGVLAELERAMEPQEELNRAQSEVNDQQSVVNSHQSDVNRAQDQVNSHQEQANRRQELLNELQSAKKDEELIKKMSAALAELQARKGATADQDTVNREQAKVNEMQAKVNEEQHKVNEQQGKVNESQARVSAAFNQRVDEILDSAVRRHLPLQLK